MTRLVCAPLGKSCGACGPLAGEALAVDQLREGGHRRSSARPRPPTIVIPLAASKLRMGAPRPAQSTQKTHARPASRWTSQSIPRHKHSRPPCPTEEANRVWPAPCRAHKRWFRRARANTGVRPTWLSLTTLREGLPLRHPRDALPRRASSTKISI